MLKLNNNTSMDAEILTEDEVFKAINSVNPELANLIQEDNLAKDFPFLKVNYPFGAKIIHNKEVFFPLVGGGSISANDPSIPESLRKNFGYTKGVNNPVGMILTRESEFHTYNDERIVSYLIIKPGQIFGFANIIDAFISRNSKKPQKSKKASVSIWSLDAGARTAFILPKISENQKHRNLLNMYGIDVEKPADYLQHRKIIRVINASLNSPWIQSVILYPRGFLDKLITDPKYLPAYHGISGIHRSSYNIWHSTYAKWDSDVNYVFKKIIATDYSAHVMEIVKHILLIVGGGVSGLAPAIDNSMLPKDSTEKAYNEGYGLTEYWPIIMQPQQFSGEETVYVSLNLFTMINCNPETFKDKTNIELLYQVMTLLLKALDYILNEFEEKDSHLYETLSTAQFSFYHDDPNPKKYGHIIKNSALLPEEDPRFYHAGFTFPVHSNFVRGCIKIEPVKR